MAGLSKCLKRIGLGKHEAALLKGNVKEYLDDGYEAHKAATQAVKDYLSDLTAERDGIVEQIRKQLGDKPAEEEKQAERVPDVDETAKSVEASSSSPVDEAAQEAATPKTNKKEFTYAVKPQGNGFILESDNGGGFVATKATGGRPLVAGGAQARVFTTAREAELYAKSKNMVLSEEPQFSRKSVADTFYSALARGVESAKQTKATSADWKAIVAKMEGVKKDEIEAVGLTEWLDIQKGPVTKEQVLEFVQANGVQVKEVTLSQKETFDSADDAIRYIGAQENMTPEEVREEYGYKEDRDYISLANTLAAQDDNVERRSDATKFASYQLPGGENYRELLLTLPETKTPKTFEQWTRENYDGSDSEHARELYAIQIDPSKPNFKSGHFDEPNILAHVRFNERTDADGKRVLFIEEVQSDWAQKGRKNGFDSDTTAILKTQEEYEKTLVEKYGTESWRPKADTLEKAYWDELSQKIRDGESGTPSAPFVTKTEAWSMLAMKRMIRWAVDNDSPGNAAWADVTKPESARQQVEKHLGGELAAVIPLKIMDVPVLAALKNDQVLKTVVEAIPVNVVNILAEHGITPENLLREGDVFGKTLPTPVRATVARGLADALEFVGARLRTALDRVLSPDASGRNEEVLPAVRAGQLDPSVVVGLLSPSRIYSLAGDVTLTGSRGADGATKLPISKSNDAGVSGEPTAAELARFLNRHKALINGSPSDSVAHYLAPAPFEKIAWANGTQQASRYDLSKQVDSIGYRKDGEDTYEISAIKDGESVMVERGKTAKQIEEIVGKEVAKKIVDGEGVPRKGGGEVKDLSGVDLKVGGEGMRQFYDVMLPQMVNKYVKKFGGKVGQASIFVDSSPRSLGHFLDWAADNGDNRSRPELGEAWATGEKDSMVRKFIADQVKTSQPSIDITPAMRDAVMQGQPLFSKKASKGSTISGILTGHGIDENLKEKAAALEKAGQSAGTFRITAGKLLDAVLDGPLSKEVSEDLRAVKVLQDLFGAPVAVIKSEGKFEFNGVYYDGTIWLNENSSVSLPLVFGHELSHRMEAGNPAAYNALLNAVKPMLRNLERYEALNSLEGYSDKFIQKEMLGDLLGDRFGEPEFWQQVAAYTGRQDFNKIVTAIRLWIDRVIARLRGLGSKKFVSDLEAARKILAKAVAEYAQTRKAGLADEKGGGQFSRAKDQTKTPEFKKWFGDSKVVDESGEPLVVYHGSSSKFNIFDIAKLNSRNEGPGFYFTTDKNVASGYVNREGSDGMMVEAYLNIRKPLPYSSEPFKSALLQKLVTRISKIEADSEGIDQRDGFLSNFADTYSKSISAAAREAATLIADDETAVDQISGIVGSGVSAKYVLQAVTDVTGYDGIVSLGFSNEGTASNTIYVAFRPEQIKSAIGNRGTFDPENPDIRFSRDTTRPAVNDVHPGLIAGYRKRAGKIIDRIDKALDPLGNLPESREYLAKRYLTLGRIAKVDEIAKGIGKAFDKATADDKQAVYDYLTTRDAAPKDIKNDLVRAEAVKTKRVIDSVGDALEARGLLDPDTREAHRGAYLPRLYLKHLLSGNDWKALGAGKKPSDMGYLKKRADISEEVRKVILGEITDPGFLAATAIAKPARDMALLDFLSSISKNEKWVLPNSMVEFGGASATPQFLKAEAERLRKQADHYAPEDAKKARGIADRMETAANKALGDMGAADLKNYKEVPNTARYGRLRGLWVRKEIYDDLVGAYDLAPQDPGFVQSLLGYGGIGTKVTQLWKMGKVALNPPSQVRNFVSNGVLLQLSGVPLRKVPVYLVRAAREIANNGKSWQVAKKFGVTESTFSTQELYRIKRDLLDLEMREGKLNPLGKLHRIGAIVADAASDAYQFSEAMYKTAKIMHAMDSGMSEADAAIDAQKWLFDYSLVPQSVRYLRNAPIGMPFLTFQYKVLPRIAEVALLHPQRLIPWVALFAGMPLLWATLAGEDDDEYEKLQKALPTWLQERGHAMILPVQDEDGRWQVVDLGYFMPWSMYTDILGDVSRGEIGEAAQTAGIFSGPLTSVIVAMKTGKDSFTGRDIVNPGDPVGRQFAAGANYAWDMMMPPIVSSRGLVSPMGLVDPEYGGKAVQAITGRTNKYGEPTATGTQTSLYPFGLNVYSIEPQHSTAQNVLRLKYEADQTELALKRKLQNRGLSDDAKQDIVQEYSDELKRRYEKVEEYKNP